jgi:hypothetical protein
MSLPPPHFDPMMPDCSSRQLFDLDFDQLPEKSRVRIFGEDYARLQLSEGGEILITRTGWARRPAVMPEAWFLDKRYATEGYRLPGGTGNVFRVDCPSPTKPNLRLVVKIARSGEDVPLHVAGTFQGHIPDEETANARWNSPFEEFGLVRELRRSRFDPDGPRMMTKRPLAIYCPPEEYKDWQLCRKSNLWRQMDNALQHAQENAASAPVHLHSRRIYIMLFEWVEGENAEDCWKAGLITEEEMKSLTNRVTRELESKGFRVLDNKPRHFILRLGADGQPIRRNGELVYTLIDFELLKRTPPHKEWLREKTGKTAVLAG